MGPAGGGGGEPGGVNPPPDGAGIDAGVSWVGGMGPGREFDLIRSFLSRRPPAVSAAIRVGPGDDAAVVAGESIVLTTDLSLEGVHFRREWIEPEEIGYRAVAAAISDLAAMAARPIGVLVSFAIAAADVERFAEPVMRGAATAVERFGAALIGGDLTRSPGPLLLDVVGVGESARPLLRRGAHPGDELWVTGLLGGAAAAVRAWLAGAEPAAAARERFARPEPRVAEAAWLAERSIPTAMLDVSDGIGGDATHIAAASDVALVIESDRVPIHPAAATHGDAADGAGLAISGGEDYELLFTCAPGAVDAVIDEFSATFDVALTRVGRVEPGSGVYVTAPGVGRGRLDASGFQHFGASE